MLAEPQDLWQIEGSSAKNAKSVVFLGAYANIHACTQTYTQSSVLELHTCTRKTHEDNGIYTHRCTSMQHWLHVPGRDRPSACRSTPECETWQQHQGLCQCSATNKMLKYMNFPICTQNCSNYSWSKDIQSGGSVHPPCDHTWSLLCFFSPGPALVTSCEFPPASLQAVPLQTPSAALPGQHKAHSHAINCRHTSTHCSCAKVTNA